MTRRTWFIAIAIGVGALVLVVGVVTGLVLLARASDKPGGDVAASTALLLDTADWGDTLADADDVAVATDTVEDILTKDVSVLRRWTTPNSRGFELRQDVLTMPSVSAAHRAFEDGDPSHAFREDLGGADPVSVTSAAHAGEAVGYCAPTSAGCFILQYTLRYGTNVIKLGLRQQNVIGASADGFLRRLDAVLSQRLT